MTSIPEKIEKKHFKGFMCKKNKNNEKISIRRVKENKHFIRKKGSSSMGLSLLSGFQSPPNFVLFYFCFFYFIFGRADQFKWKILTTPFDVLEIHTYLKWIKDKIFLEFYATEHKIEPGFIFSFSVKSIKGWTEQ